MRKLFTFICVAFMPLLMNSVFAQDTLIAWTFPSTSADSLADAGVAALSYSTRYISCQYGHANGRIPISYTATGAGGGSDKCAMATGWTNDPDSANWMVKFKTTGYSNLMVYSKQLSDGTNPGPRDFKVQYKLPGASSPWIDLGTTVTCANDWTTGVVNGVSLPATCDNQSSQVGVRWMVNSQLDINGNALLSTGISEIDDIVITGTSTVGINETGSENIIKVYPNPNNGNFFIENNGEINKITVFDILGKCVYVNENAIESRTYLTGFEKGVYLVQVTTKDNGILTHKIVVE